mmetsp:Transcript_38007/g.87842  ORF Transcript_38007/g.87842 Transcript_38007/m.87842 type:complete len:453 (+) Transcript_38007:73-1431(+)
MSNQEALQQVHPDSNACDSASLSSWYVASEVSSGSSGGEERAIPSAWQPDVAAVREAQRLECLQLSEQHLRQLEKRKDEAEEEFKKQWWLTRDLLGSASMACGVEACLEAAQAAPREHPTGLLGQYAAWHHEVQQESARLRALREDNNQLRCDEDELVAQLADVQGSMQKNPAETMNTGKDVSYEQLSKQTGDLKHMVTQLTDGQGAAQVAVHDVAALKERMEEFEKQFHQLKFDKDATIERLSNVKGALDAAVKDAVSAAMKDGPERELERVKASLNELSSPQNHLNAAPPQSPPRTTHAFDVFAHLKFSDRTICGNVQQWQIRVTLVRSSNRSILVSDVAPCKLCHEKRKTWVDDTEALHQCVTGLLASHAGGPEQRWAYVAGCSIDNLSSIREWDLQKRKPLPPGSCNLLDMQSVEWLQAWLRNCSPDVAITDADVKRGTRHYYPKRSN